MPRLAWHQLPAEARQAVTAHTGPIHEAHTASDGMNSGIAARLVTDSGRLFVKGISTDYHQVSAQDREAAVNPFLPASCPRLLWRVQVTGWDLLGYELLENVRASDYTPGSPDLPLVAAAVEELGHVRCPDVPLKSVTHRWSDYAGPDLPLFEGDRLLHTDLAPDNVLVGDGRAHLIDWAWPTRGPGWVDPSVLAVRLIYAGHTPESATGWVEKIPAWHNAPPGAREAFARANAGLWAQIEAQSTGDAFTSAMADSAKAWAGHLSS